MFLTEMQVQSTSNQIKAWRQLEEQLQENCKKEKFQESQQKQNELDSAPFSHEKKIILKDFPFSFSQKKNLPSKVDWSEVNWTV